MEYLKQQLKEKDRVIICSNKLKSFIKENFDNSFIYAKVVSFDDFISDIYHEINTFDLIKNYDPKENLSITKIKLDNSLLITKPTSEAKLNELRNLKEKNKFEISLFVKSYYLKKKVIVIDYYHDNDLLNIALKNINAEFYYLKAIDYVHHLNVFEDFTDEVFYIVNEINALIKNGVSPSKIYIDNSNDSYNLLFKEALTIYKIPYNMHESVSLYDIGEVRQFFDELLKEKDKRYDEAISEMLVKKEATSNIIDALDALEAITIRSDLKTISDLEELIIYILKHTFKKCDDDFGVNLIDITSTTSFSDEYYFLPSFSLNFVPKAIRDNLYLSDDERIIQDLLTSKKMIKIKEKRIISWIKGTKNLQLSHAKKCNAAECTKSALLDKEELAPFISISNKEFTLNEVSSINMARLIFAKSVEKLRLYNEVTNDFILGYQVFNEIIQNKYESSFTKIDEDIISCHNKNLTLSYTSLDEYLKCPFLYYLKYVLKLKANSEFDNSLFIGNLFHKVLEEYIQKKYLDHEIIDDLQDFIDCSVSSFLEELKIEVTSKLELYLKILKDHLLNTLKRITDFHDTTLFEVVALEENYKIDFPGFSLTGKIDKVLRYNSYYVVIDYKTSNLNVEFKNLDKGLELQLPIYLMFIKNAYDNALIGGCYLESILKATPYRYSDDNKELQFLKYTRFKGFTTDDKQIIKALDMNYNNDFVILSTKPFKKDGEFTIGALKRFLPAEYFDQIIQYSKTIIEGAVKKIKRGEFMISPIKVEKNNACDNCKMKSICYVNDLMVRKLVPNNDLSYIFKKDGASCELE